jgi:hypothetical protein
MAFQHPERPTSIPKDNGECLGAANWPTGANPFTDNFNRGWLIVVLGNSIGGLGDKDQIITMAAKRNIPPDLVRVKTFRVIGHAHRLGMRLVDTVFYRRSCQ